MTATMAREGTTEAELKTRARAAVAELVRRFEQNETSFLRPQYNETQARSDFITPLLAAFGWDVQNQSGLPLGLREVIEEANVQVSDEKRSKRPDYELRLARQRKLFVEAKKPAVRIGESAAAALQTRRYGFSANLPIAVLTNFRELAIYDCLPAPAITDAPSAARLLLVPYTDYEARFDEIWFYLSRYRIYSGEFDRHFAAAAARRGTEQFDTLFLGQIRSWRERLAIDIQANTPGLSSEELTYAVQLFLTRIVFLRICEDREIERYETLRNLSGPETFQSFMAELRRADAFYNSGLFRLLDDQALAVRVSDGVLRSIIAELYYPQSPYTFAVVESQVLGEIYEQFLGEVIEIDGRNRVRIVEKPEVRASGGVVPTPRYIADAIVTRTLQPLLQGKSPTDLAEFTVADICCGSGVFLLSAYELLLDHALSWYLGQDRGQYAGRTIYDSGGGQWRLTVEERRRILLTHLRGVDIDPNAVEVAQFGLLLKLIEHETAEGLRDYVDTHRAKALPPLDGIIRTGNSLISENEWAAAVGPLPHRLLKTINPFNWNDEFAAEMAAGGFSAILGNPPYVRIQTLMGYSPEEGLFYQSPQAPYTTARQDAFDKYALFIERALSLVGAEGRIGFIVPNKFLTIQSGRALRRLLTDSPLVREIVHFGVEQVFASEATNYTCLIILDRSGGDSVEVERVGSLETWRYGTPGPRARLALDRLGEESWQFASDVVRALFARIRSEQPLKLGEAADIFVGVQTSADGIFIFEQGAETAKTAMLVWNGEEWPIEKAILRPCLLDVPLPAYSVAKPNAWMIFPYELVDAPRGKRARLIQPADMRTRFPACWRYLQARRRELERRNITGGAADECQFYQFGRSQSLTKFRGPKIILNILSLEARYAYDEAEIVVTGGGNGPYYMVRAKSPDVTDHYLLALLHHPLSEAMIRNHTSSFRGGYYSHGKQFIENLPVPRPRPTERKEIEGLVEQILGANEAAAGARIPNQARLYERRAAALAAQIEAKVTSLFRLSPEDMGIARSVPIPGL